MMVKRPVTIAEATPLERREFFEEMGRFVREADLTVREVAHQVGLSHGYVHKAIHGPVYPSVESVRRILAALGRADESDRMVALLNRDAQPPSSTRDATGDRSPAEPESEATRTRTRRRYEDPGLSQREIQILRQWVLADSKETIAQQLFISESTVNTHITRIRAKYAAIGRPATTKAALLARALQDGIIDLDDI